MQRMESRERGCMMSKTGTVAEEWKVREKRRREEGRQRTGK